MPAKGVFDAEPEDWREAPHHHPDDPERQEPHSQDAPDHQDEPADRIVEVDVDEARQDGAADDALDQGPVHFVLPPLPLTGSLRMG